jgi:hypothetical protein
MRTGIKLVLVLVGAVMVFVGAQSYFAATHGLGVTPVDQFLNGMKRVAVASVVLVGGMGLIVKTVF